MAVLTSSLLLDLSALAVIPIVLLVLLVKSKLNYWKDRGVPYVKPDFVFGSFKDNILGKSSVNDILKKVYHELKGQRFGGFYDFIYPNLMILDPDLISKILVKDFNHFYNRGFFSADPEQDPLTNSMGFMNDKEWRYQRQHLSPVFSSGKLKGMTDQMYNCGDALMKELEKYAESGKELEAKDVLSMFTIDVIGSCGFGLQFNVHSPQGANFKHLASNAFPTSRFLYLSLVLTAIYKNLARKFGIRVFPKNVTDYFINLSKETVRYRKENNIERNDYLNKVLELKKREESNTIHIQEEKEVVDTLINQLDDEPMADKSTPNGTKVMTDEWVAASSFMFLLAGSEVSSTTSLALYCLAANPEVQERLQKEVDHFFEKHRTLNHESVKDLVYMDQVLQETLRMYPTVGFIPRICTIPYRIPDSDVVLEKGTRVTIPMWPLQIDPEHYKDPHVFDPERFIDNNYKPSSTYMPFGDGPRICIGMRFALLEMKICLARIMSQYSVHLSKNMTEIQWDPQFVFSRVKDGVWVTVSKRK